MKCLWCNTKLTGNRKKFCSNKHKDKWHNTTNPRGFGTRITRSREDAYNHDPVEDDMHPHDSYSLGQE
jgi:hypothetical protein